MGCERKKRVKDLVLVWEAKRMEVMGKTLGGGSVRGRKAR